MYIISKLEVSSSQVPIKFCNKASLLGYFITAVIPQSEYSSRQQRTAQISAVKRIFNIALLKEQVKLDT